MLLYSRRCCTYLVVIARVPVAIVATAAVEVTKVGISKVGIAIVVVSSVEVAPVVVPEGNMPTNPLLLMSRQEQLPYMQLIRKALHIHALVSKCCHRVVLPLMRHIRRSHKSGVEFSNALPYIEVPVVAAANIAIAKVLAGGTIWKYKDGANRCSSTCVEVKNFD